MKKILLFLAAASLLTSCKNLGDNEYEVSGTIDKSADGTKVILERQGGMFGFAPVDTTVVKDGKFEFKGTAEEPGLRFLKFEAQPKGKVEFVLEEGAIKLEVNKDTLQNSKRSGTFNNDKLSEYYAEAKSVRQKMIDFQKQHEPEMMQARKNKDTATAERLRTQFSVFNKELEQKANAFLKKNPDSYVSLLLVKTMSPQTRSFEEIRKAFDALDPKIKKYKEAQEFSKLLDDAQGKGGGTKKAEPGQIAPDFTANTPGGKPLSLNQVKGKVTVIDFWASWCQPCRKENPKMVALYKEFHSQGLNVIGVSLDKDADAWKKAIADDKLEWNQVSNLKHWEDPIAATYGIESIPATIVLDASGKIVAKDLHGDALRMKVKNMLTLAK